MEEQKSKKVDIDTGPKGVAAKLAKIMGEIERIPKNGYNKHGKFYYATADDVAAATRPLFAKYNLAIRPEVVHYEIIPAEQAEGSTLLAYEFKYHLTCADTGETVIHNWAGWANMKMGRDKAPFIAATGAQKYWLKNLLILDTGDESDSDTGGIDTPVNPAITAVTYKKLQTVIDERNTQREEPIDPTSLIAYICKRFKRDPVEDLTLLTEREGQVLIKMLENEIAKHDDTTD